MNPRNSVFAGLVILGCVLMAEGQDFSIITQDDFYQEITNSAVLNRPVWENAVQKNGDGVLTLQNPRMPNSSLEILDGSVVVSETNTFVAPELPVALQTRAAFWVDANTNVVADGGGVVSRWHDVREASVDGPYSYMMATNSETSPVLRQPTVVSDASLGGKKYLDFGSWGTDNSRWLFWADSDGALKTLNLRSVFIVFGSHNGNTSKGGSITLIQNTANLAAPPLAPFAPKDDRLWYYTSDNVMADDGPNYLDRVQRNGHVLQIKDKAYHLLETFTLSPASANTFAKDRNLPQYSGGSRICEAIFFADELSNEERLQVQEYLWHKWLGRSDESSLGSFVLGHNASLAIEAGTNDLQLTLSGDGTVSKKGTGTVALMNRGDNTFDGIVRLREGNLLVGGETFLFDVEEGGQTLYAQDINVNRSSAAAGTVVKTGTGELAVASIDPSITEISVTDGTLRLAAPPVPTPSPAANADVNEPSLEAFDTSATAPWANFTPAGTGVTTVNGWRFDRTAYSSGNFLVGVAFDYTDRSGNLMTAASAPDGHTVLYINRGLAETDFTVPASGIYRLSFYAAARPGNPNRHVEVQIDGETIRTIITPSTTFWKHDMLLPFLSSGSHTIGFEGIGETLTEFGRVAFIDDIHVSAVRLCDEAPVTAVLTNGGFEMPFSLIEAGTITVNEPTGTGWTYSGLAGLGRIQSIGASLRRMPVAVPDGIGVGFIPEDGTISQDVTFPTSGVYRLSFDTATRHGLFNHSYDVKLDGDLIHQVKTTDSAFREVDLILPPVTTGTELELAFVGTGTEDQCSLIDNVRIERVEDDLALGVVSNGGFEVVYDAGDRLLPSNWVCTALTRAFSDDNPWGERAPYGEYFGTFSMTHSFAQDVTFPAGGSYAVRFITKTRDAYAPAEYHDFEITLDGERVAHIYNMGDDIREYIVPLPPVSAGTPYELKFKGLQTYANNGTVSIFDQIEIIPAACRPHKAECCRTFPGINGACG